MNPDLLLAQFERISDAPDAVVRIRAFIVELAVRGKLVEQDLRTERVPDDYVNEPTFDHLPKNWRLLNFRKFCDIQGGNQPPKSQFVDSPMPGYVRLFQIRDLGESPVPVYIPADSTNRFCREGEILIGRYGASVGKVFWAQNGAYNVALAKFIYPQDAFTAQFAFLVLKSDFLQSRLTGSTRSAQAGFNKKDLAEVNLPLPPLPEQIRIVAKVDELMSLCDRLEDARREQERQREGAALSALHHLTNGASSDSLQQHSRFYLDHFADFTANPSQIPELRRAILNLAVRGRLVLQDHENEPSSELFKRIQTDKLRRIEGGSLRKERPLPAIADGEEPFAIPVNWIWTRIGMCALLTEYGTSVRSDELEDGIPVLAMGDIQNGKVILNERKKVPRKIEDLPQLLLKRFDLLYNRTNSAELVGKTGIYLGDDDAYTFASYLIRIRFNRDLINPVYVNLAMNAPYFRETQIVPELRQQCGQANVNGSKLRNMMIPLPPIAEQGRIVASVEELMTLCSRFEGRLSATQEQKSNLLESILHYSLSHSKGGRYSAPPSDPGRLNSLVANSPREIAAANQNVFAFGSNMCSGRFRDYGVSPEGPGRPAKLTGYCLVFNKKSTDDKSGKANVIPREGSDVWGVLYAISDDDLSKLDRGEGGYRREQLQIRLSDNANATAWVYVAKKPSDDPALRPYTWYKRFLIEGAREHSLPAEYIATLENINATQDANAQRDRRKRALACQAAP
jgi:type I restriction enzyme S subunit